MKLCELTHGPASAPMVRRPPPWSGVRPSSSSSTISNMNISATSGPITIKFYQMHHWDGGKAALGFGPDWIKTLVSMATDSSHRVISIPMVQLPPVVVIHNFKHEYLCNQWADHNKILSDASLGCGKGFIRFRARLDQNSGFHGNR